MYGGPWLGSLVPCPFRGGGFPPTSSSIIAKYLETVGTQTQERRCSILPGCLLACPEFIKQCRGWGWGGHRKGTSRDLFQAFSPSMGLAQGPAVCCVSCPRGQIYSLPKSGLCPHHGNHLSSAGQAWGPWQLSESRGSLARSLGQCGWVSPVLCTQWPGLLSLWAGP